MPCNTLRHRGFRRGHGLSHGPVCKRCALGSMTIPQLLNQANICRATPPCNRNQRPRNCETYQRECIRSFSDDEPDCSELNNDNDSDYKCEATPQAKLVRVLVRECTYSDENCSYARPASDPAPYVPQPLSKTSNSAPPCPALTSCETPPTCHTPPPCERSVTWQTSLRGPKPVPCENLITISPECSNTIIKCDDCYVEIPCHNTDTTGDHVRDRTPRIKPPPCNKLPHPWQTSPPNKSTFTCEPSQSIVICDPDEDKICRRVSFGSVSELKVPSCQKEGICIEAARIIEIPSRAIASTEMSPQVSESCSTQMEARYTCSKEAQSDLGVVDEKAILFPIGVFTQTCSDRIMPRHICGAKNCPKSKHEKDSRKSKQQKAKKETKCGKKDCPKTSSEIDYSPPCFSPSTSDKKFEHPDSVKKQIECKCPLSPSKLPTSPSTSGEPSEKESESKLNLQKKSSKTGKKKCLSKIKSSQNEDQKVPDVKKKKSVCKCPLSLTKSPTAALTPSTSNEITSGISIKSSELSVKGSKRKLCNKSSSTSKRKWFRKSEVKAPPKNKQNTTTPLKGEQNTTSEQNITSPANDQNTTPPKNEQRTSDIDLLNKIDEEQTHRTATLSSLNGSGIKFSSGGQYVQQTGFTLSAQGLPSGFTPSVQSIHSVVTQCTRCCGSYSGNSLREQHALGKLFVPQRQNLHSQTEYISPPYKSTLASQKPLRKQGSCSTLPCKICPTTRYGITAQRNHDANGLRSCQDCEKVTISTAGKQFMQSQLGPEKINVQNQLLQPEQMQHDQLFDNGQSLSEQFLMTEQMLPNQLPPNGKMPQSAMHTALEGMSQTLQISPSQFKSAEAIKSIFFRNSNSTKCVLLKHTNSLGTDSAMPICSRTNYTKSA